ncbi:phosphotransferase [Paenibacillus sp. VCA1]|uniref:phosphotransferase n=1 Tax=Paenibacillus sp. VCA1 TaxID=3039148 RepID=UPI0028725FF1|nr:phosphotransferase [Paenibacillus sp. VCA1]MDR9854229.1 phosphotransferase [Paenibacillus sp. VCA1]
MREIGVTAKISENRLKAVSKQILQTDDGFLSQWDCEPIGPKNRNFVTDGVYRVSGKYVIGGAVHEWTAILKIVLADPNRDDPAHYNYWRREVLAYESGLLKSLPASFRAPECYAIDEQDDGSVWLWLEDIPHESKRWERGDYAFAAAKLGEFHAAYVLGQPLPDFSWINRHWMRSWIHECKKYRQVHQESIAKHPAVSSNGLTSVIDRFAVLETLIPEWLAALERLPRTFSHQDYYESNILLTPDGLHEGSLALIDWQFASISGVGEDLGRFFGLSVSRGQVPLESYRDDLELFISSYISGLKGAGWRGDEALPRFGCLAAFALRAVWEVPKLLKKLEQDPKAPESRKLMRIAEMQMEAAEEAEALRRQLMLKKI